MRRKLLLISLIVSVSIVISACGSNNNANNNTAPGTGNTAPGTENTAPGTDNNVTAAADAEKLFKQNCTSCHGDTMNRMKNADLTTVGSRLNTDEIADVITNGRNGMIAFKNKLDTVEIETLADWLSTMK